MHLPRSGTGNNGRRVVSAFTATAFGQDDAESARTQWRRVADQLRPKLPKLALFRDEADVLAYMTFPAAHCQSARNPSVTFSMRQCGVNFGRRSPRLGGQYCRPNDTKATSRALSTCQTHVPRSGCRPKSSTSTSCRRRLDPSSTSRATFRCQYPRTSNLCAKGAGRCVSCRPASAAGCLTQGNSVGEMQCRSMNISVTNVVHSRTCARCRNATICKPVRPARPLRRG